MRSHCLLFIGILFSSSAISQERAEPSFGKVLLSDFSLPSSTVVDGNSNAVIVADIGSLNFVGNEHHWFSYVFKRYTRIKIVSDRAQDLSTVEIRLYGYGKDKAQLSELQAATYNIENGSVETTTLAKTDVFEDKLSAYTSIMKFSLPKVKIGSIVEYSYTITSRDDYNLPTWYFQHMNYPCLHSEYKAVFPSALRYLTVRYGRDSFAVNRTSIAKNDKYIMADLTVTSNDIMDYWSMDNIPAFGSEKFIGAPIDYLDKIDFVLAQTYNGEDLQDVGTNWRSVTNDLLGTSYFGLAIDKEYAANLLNTANNVTSGDKSLEESARDIYYYIRDNFTCTPDNEIFVEEDLYDVNKKKKGNVAEINLLLTALLRQKGIQADPVILSTTDFGRNPSDYPVLRKMNYVICMMRLNGDTTYLDASRPYLGFGNLSIDCYNGHSRIISTNGGPLYFLPEDIKEQTSTTAFVFNKEKGKLAGSISIAYGVFGSEKLRKEIMSVGQTKYFENIKTQCAGEPTFVQTAVDSLHKPEFPATVHVDFEMPFTGDILYFNPVIHTEYSKNPFNSDQRKYPVVLPYPIDELYTLNMEIPEGYAVDELPKSTKVSFNGNDGSFEYLIQADQNSIQFRTHIRLSEVNFPAEDYGSLRDFFAFILKKYGEQIVLKRKQP